MRKVEVIDYLVPVKTAIISVSDKTGLDVLVPGLIEANPEIKILSTGGTYKRLGEIVGPNNSNVLEVSEYTGMPETEGGLVKTLHHMLFLGYLTETHCQGHQDDLAREDAAPIDLVVFNLYPFEKTVAQEGIDVETARMNIDVGGPSTLRAAAKNWHRVATVVKPSTYEGLLREIQSNGGNTTLGTRFELQKGVWEHLATYNRAIADHFASVSLEDAKKPYTILNPSKD